MSEAGEGLSKSNRSCGRLGLLADGTIGMDGASQTPRPRGGELGGENCIKSSGSEFMPASGSHAWGSVEMFDGDVALFKRTQKGP